MMETRCPGCGHRFATALTAGLKGSCPKCLADFVLAEAPALAGTFRGLEILAVVGEGGMGKVYRARHPQLGREVAVKTLSPALAGDPEFVERFMREARALASLDHPNIVRVHDVGEEGGTCFIVMEFVDGVPLRSLLGKGLVAREALALIGQICDALEYAHGRGVVHRDIKPENILVDRDGRVKIADFGLAKIKGEGPGVTRTDVAMGTPHYMAPEQVERMKDVDHRADIYSLGVVFYEMLTGELPLGRFAPPSRRKAELDARLDDVVMRTLEKEPAQRYQHACEVKEHVTRIGATPAGDPAERPTFARVLVFAAAVALGLPPVALRLASTAFESWLGAGFATAFYATHAAVAALGLATIALSIAARRRRHPAGALLWVGVCTTVCAVSLAFIPIARRPPATTSTLVFPQAWPGGLPDLPEEPRLAEAPRPDWKDVQRAIAEHDTKALRAHGRMVARELARTSAPKSLRQIFWPCPELNEEVPEHLADLKATLEALTDRDDLTGSQAVDGFASGMMLAQRSDAELLFALHEIARWTPDSTWGPAAQLVALRVVEQLAARGNDGWLPYVRHSFETPWVHVRRVTRTGERVTDGPSIYSTLVFRDSARALRTFASAPAAHRASVGAVFADLLALHPSDRYLYATVAASGDPAHVFGPLVRAWEGAQPSRDPAVLLALLFRTRDADDCRQFWARRAAEKPAFEWMPIVTACGLSRSRHPDLKTIFESWDASDLAAGIGRARIVDPASTDAHGWMLAIAVILTGFRSAQERDMALAELKDANRFGGEWGEMLAREAQALAAATWLPLVAGTRWIYEQDGVETVVAVGEKSKMADIDCWPVDNFGPWGVFKERAWIGERRGRTAIYRLGKSQVDLPLLVEPLAAGATWKAQSFFGDVAGHFRASVPVADEEVVVPAGTFRCVRVTMSFADGEGTSGEWTSWYARGVGPVRSTFALKGQPPIERRLKRVEGR